MCPIEPRVELLRIQTSLGVCLAQLRDRVIAIAVAGAKLRRLAHR